MKFQKFRKLAAKRKYERLADIKNRMAELYNKYDLMENGNKKAMGIMQNRLVTKKSHGSIMQNRMVTKKRT